MGVSVGFAAFIVNACLYEAFVKTLGGYGWNREFIFQASALIVVGIPLSIFARFVPASCPECEGRAYIGRGRRASYFCLDCGREISWSKQAKLRSEELARLKFLGRWQQKGPLAGMLIGASLCGSVGLILAAIRVFTHGGGFRGAAYIVAAFGSIGFVGGALVGIRDLERANEDEVKVE